MLISSICFCGFLLVYSLQRLYFSSQLSQSSNVYCCNHIPIISIVEHQIFVSRLLAFSQLLSTLFFCNVYWFDWTNDAMTNAILRHTVFTIFCLWIHHVKILFSTQHRFFYRKNLSSQHSPLGQATLYPSPFLSGSIGCGFSGFLISMLKNI